MGSSAGVHSRHAPLSPYDKNFFSLFVDSALMDGESELRRDKSFRESFVEYIKGGGWMEKLTKFENVLIEAEDDVETPTWTKYGYECPSECGIDNQSSSARSGSTQLSSGSSRKSEHPVVSREAQVARATLQECYSAIQGWTLFLEKAELRAILFAALYPMYVQSSAYRQFRNPSNGWRRRTESDDSDEADDISFCSQFSTLQQSRKAKKSERLRGLLVGTAALFDSSELEQFLEDPDISWIEDFKGAITNLPVNVMVCKMNRESSESKVVYSNVKRINVPTIPESEEFPESPSQLSQRNSPTRGLGASFGLPNCSSRDSADGCGSPQADRIINIINSSNNNNIIIGSSSSSAKSSKINSSAIIFSDKVGKNLLDLHTAGHSAESVKQMETAIFNARFHKQRFVRSNGDFHLRALKPVFTAHGRYACTLSVDAFAPADHTSGVMDLLHPPETRFQEVEDVLALLPLFIKA